MSNLTRIIIKVDRSACFDAVAAANSDMGGITGRLGNAFFVGEMPDFLEAVGLAAYGVTVESVGPALADANTIETYYARQIEWSRQTFGPALRTGGVIDHIRKELCEIEAQPHDLAEWVDVIILAMDGYWRHGGTVDNLMPALLAKQARNIARTWPDWRSMSEDSAIEHDRSGEATE